MKKETYKEAFIRKANIVHSNLYSYSKVNYIDSKTNVVITCEKHGDFVQKPNNHIQKYGCPKCGIENRTNKSRLTKEGFLAKAKSIHGDTYIYDEVSWENVRSNKDEVKIACKVHGVFTQIINRHLAGSGCRACGIAKSRTKNRLTKDEFLLKVNMVHKKEYSYDKLDWNSLSTLKDRVTITCHVHGDFRQIASNHLLGQGCKICGFIKSGWDYTSWSEKGKSSKFFDGFKLYVIKVSSSTEKFLKVGKTFNTLTTRFNQLPYKYEILFVKKGSARDISILEAGILKNRELYTYTPEKSFAGMTECLRMDALPHIKKRLDKK